MSTDVRKWLAALGTLCSVPVADAEAKTRVEAYAAMLTREFQPWAFCGGSLAHVARSSRFWPTYGELCDRLSEWCRANMPTGALPRLEGPKPLSPDEYRRQQDDLDRAWWAEKIASWADLHPSERWLRGKRCMAQMSQPDSWPRPWIVPMLGAVIDRARADGADTTQPVPDPVPYPKRTEKPRMPRLARVPAEKEDA